jgi:hypothetical protein
LTDLDEWGILGRCRRRAAWWPVAGGRPRGPPLTGTTAAAAPAESAKTITYLVDKKWDLKNLLYGQNGIAAPTFCEVPLEPATPAP